MTSSGRKQAKHPGWHSWVERVESFIVAVLAALLVGVVFTVLLLTLFLFASNLRGTLAGIETVADIQEAALHAFSGVLLVLLGLELLDTVKVYFQDHRVRVEVILLVGLIAMGRQVLEIDLHHVEPLILLGFSSLVLVLAISYYLVRKAHVLDAEREPRAPGD